jgi:hypothetical protein
MNHYQVLEKTSTSFAILINPAAYKFSSFSGAPDFNAILACNVNYSWLGIPIGIVRSEGRDVGMSLSAKMKIRPCLTITEDGKAELQYSKDFNPKKYSLVLQAGPTLLINKRNVATAAAKTEEFRDDAIRKTTHVAIGTTAAGKIVIGYLESTTIKDLANFMLKHKCLDAMKCDAGNATALWFRENGLTHTSVHYGKNNNCRAGLQFISK